MMSILGHLAGTVNIPQGKDMLGCCAKTRPVVGSPLASTHSSSYPQTSLKVVCPIFDMLLLFSSHCTF